MSPWSLSMLRLLMSAMISGPAKVELMRVLSLLITRPPLLNTLSGAALDPQMASTCFATLARSLAPYTVNPSYHFQKDKRWSVEELIRSSTSPSTYSSSTSSSSCLLSIIIDAKSSWAYSRWGIATC